jgi:hypothetical protein
VHVIACHCMSLHVIACHCMSLHACIDASHSLVVYGSGRHTTRTRTIQGKQAEQEQTNKKTRTRKRKKTKSDELRVGSDGCQLKSIPFHPSIFPSTILINLVSSLQPSPSHPHLDICPSPSPPTRVLYLILVQYSGIAVDSAEYKHKYCISISVYCSHCNRQRRALGARWRRHFAVYPETGA